jgi:HlyD family secretion protein
MRTKLAYLIFIVLFYSCKKRAEKTSPVIEKITSSVYAAGVIKAKNQYRVFSAVNGLIKEIFVSEGDVVKKGDPLMQVLNETAKLNSENAQLAAEYASVNANLDKLKELKVNIEQAKDKMDNDLSLLERQKNLWLQNIGTRNDLEQRELNCKNSVNIYQAAVLRYNELKKQLDFAAKQSQKNLQISTSNVKDFTIKSETDGKVYSILKEKGEMVSTQSPVAVVGNAEDFFLELQVDEYDIAGIRIDQKTLIKLDSYRGQVFEGKITKINPIMNERSKSFTVEAAFTTKPGILFPNLTAETNIVIETKAKALLIPRSYLIDESFVMLENKEKRKVTVGLKDYEKAEILSGLNVQEVILKPVK